MIDFIFKFKELSLLWQSKKTQNYSLTQIAEYTGTSLPYVIKYISDTLQVELEYTQLISYSEAKNILETLGKKYKTEIDERIKVTQAKTKKLESSYELIAAKANRLQLLGQWDSAFRTLSYFAGEYTKDLSKDLFVNLCSNIVRCGIRAENINLQEISFWLKKAVEVNLSEHTEDSLHDALDLVETYSDYFQHETTGKGKAILVDILSLLESPAYDLQLWGTYKSCVDKIFLDASSKNSQL